MQYNWNGSDGSYTDDANWTPTGVPLYGNGTTALIQSGTVTLSNAAPNGIFISLSAPSAATQPNLVLDNAALGSDVSLSLVPLPGPTGQPSSDLGFATITVDGYDTSQATIVLGGRRSSPDSLNIAIAPYGQLNQEGTISLYNGSQLRVHGTGQAPAMLNNDGAINIAGANAIISADVIGSGTIGFVAYPEGGGTVEFAGGVAATQHISFNQNASGGNVLIDDPSTFHGIIDGFDAFRNVTLANTQATGAYFAQVAPDSGALLLLNGQEVVGALTVKGGHASNAYGIISNPDGSTTVTLVQGPPS